jgi:hypothetical protein
MIADSNDDVGDLIVRPTVGVAYGIAAAAASLALLAALQGGTGVQVWLGEVGRVFLPGAGRSADALLYAGLVAHLTIGGVLGALHAACQQRTTLSGLLVVGGFYGFVAWLVAELVFGRWLGVGPALLRSWTGMGLLMAYGLGLAACAAAEQARTGRRQRSAKPID